MSDKLRSFLFELGLLQFYEALAVEQIEPEDLALLSDADLVQIGIPLGPRRRLQNAITLKAQNQPPQMRERRNLTVLFCDMYDSTSVAAQLDPEELRARYLGFHDACRAEIEAQEGYAAQRFGDGVLAYFGFPHALEDAAICAIRAGLGIVARMGVLDVPGGQVAVRVGIASGLTVVEQATDTSDDKEEIATGATLTLAARLQGVAQPGEVIISDETRKLVRNHFHLASLGETELKGFPHKQILWRASQFRERPEPLPNSPAPAALLGRGVEFDALTQHMNDCKAGQGHALILEGEAGIGKSRLLQELQGAAHSELDTITLNCSRYRHGAAFHPVTDWLNSKTGGPGASDKLSGLDGVSSESEPLLARVMGLGPDHAEQENLSPALQRAILDALVTLLAPGTGAARLLMIEDLHWADSETLGLLERLAEHAHAHPLLIVATTRPQVARLPSGFAKMTLAALAQEHTKALVNGQSGAAAIPEAVRQTIIERSGGVPLFAEELTRSVLEAPDATDSTVPLTLQDTLMARLDRLSAGKPTAQIGALFGLSFSLELLEASAEMPKSVLKTGLDELTAANLLETDPKSPNLFKFRHALVRDVAYSSLLHSQRKVLHHRVAQAFENQFSELAADQPEQVADHYTLAQDYASALPFWERAADLALAKAAPTSAIPYFQNALEHLAHQAASPARDEREVDLRIRLNMALTITTGFASQKTEENLARLSEFFETMEPSEAVQQLLWGRSMSALVSADFVSARKAAGQLARVAERSNLPNAPRMPERFLGYVSMLEGQLNRAEEHFEHVLEGYEPQEFDPILAGHPFDMLAATLAQRAILMALRDKTDELDRDQRRALARLTQFDSPATAFQVLVHLCLARFELEDYDGVLPLLEKLRELVDGHQIAPLYVKIWEAWRTAHNGDLEGGLAAMEQAEQDEDQYPLWSPAATLLRVKLLMKANRPSAALETLNICEAEITHLGHNYLLAEAKRLRAKCRSKLGGPKSEVEQLLREAIGVATRQGASRFARIAKEDLESFL